MENGGEIMEQALTHTVTLEFESAEACLTQFGKTIIDFVGYNRDFIQPYLEEYSRIKSMESAQKMDDLLVRLLTLYHEMISFKEPLEHYLNEAGFKIALAEINQLTLLYELAVRAFKIIHLEQTGQELILEIKKL